MKRKLLFIIFLGFLSYATRAQFIDNKLNIYFGPNYGSFSGKKIIEKNYILSPSLYANYNDLNGLHLKTLVRMNSLYSIGVGLDYCSASYWEYLENIDFVNSGVIQYSISPTIQFHKKLDESGISNRLKIIIEIAPNFGVSKLSLPNPLFDIQSLNDGLSIQLQSNDQFVGFKGNVGLEVSISQLIGIYINYSMHNNWTVSKLYLDNHFTSSFLGFGFIIKLNKDKRYTY